MSSANYYITPHGDLYIIYGTQAPYGGTTVGSNLLAVNETNPYKPALAWAYHVTDAINTGLGDVPHVVEQRNGIALTDVLVNTGTSSAPVLNIRLIAVDTQNGNLLWTTFAEGVPSEDAGFVPVAFKGSVPMVHNGVLYVGDLLDQTYQAHNVEIASSTDTGDQPVLSRRELEVLTAGNLDYRAIARSLFISPSTVRAHATAIYRKLGVHDRRAAIRRARQFGILPSGDLVETPGSAQQDLPHAPSPVRRDHSRRRRELHLKYTGNTGTGPFPPA